MTKKQETTQAEAAQTDQPQGTDIKQDLSFQRKWWPIQRIGWFLFALTIAAGLAGLLGTGPLASTTASGGSGFEVEYERFTHRESPTTFTIHPGDTPLSDEGTLEIAMSQSFISNYQIERIIPEPVNESMSGENLIYSFKVAEGGPSTITIFVEAEDAGLWQGSIGPATLNQFVYP